MQTNPRIVKVKKTPESWWTPGVIHRQESRMASGAEESCDHTPEYKQVIKAAVMVGMMMMVVSLQAPVGRSRPTGLSGPGPDFTFGVSSHSRDGGVAEGKPRPQAV